ncbi:haloacid dehalogenase [Xylariomycetidae sp. FL2044]|nr:haloacid dehalogenase [Xylariomycetidae sp. FL2044]
MMSKAASPAPAPPSPPDSLKHIKALTFDVFGTVVDWRSTVIRELTQKAHELITAAPESNSALSPALRSRLQSADWARFAQEWRDSYGVFTRTFEPGRTAWKDVDAHHYDSLVSLLEKWELADAFFRAGDDDGDDDDDDDEAGGVLRDLSLVWHRLAPWPDAAEGIRRLGTTGGLVTSTLSNGNRSLLADLDASGGLGFRRLISTADFGAYKPHPSTYLGAARALGCAPREVAMVAAHLGDLAAARSCGLRTIYVEREREEAWDAGEARYREARGWVDLWIRQDEEGFVEVARRLGFPE